MWGDNFVSRSPQEKRVVVYHEDRTAADRVVKRLSQMGYQSVRPETEIELQGALSEHCQALLVSSIKCDQKMFELFDRAAPSQFRPAIVILTKTATEQCAAVERLERLHIQARKFPLADLKSN